MTAAFAAASLLLAGGAGMMASLLVAPVRGLAQGVGLLLLSALSLGIGFLLLAGPRGEGLVGLMSDAFGPG